MVYVGVGFIGCAWAAIGDAPDIGEGGGIPDAEGMAFGFHTPGARFIICPLLAAIVASIWGSDIVVNSSQATPVSIVGWPENSAGAIGRSIRVRNYFKILSLSMMRQTERIASESEPPTGRESRHRGGRERAGVEAGHILAGRRIQRHGRVWIEGLDGIWVQVGWRR